MSSSITPNNLIEALKAIDPILQFLTKATNNSYIPFSTLQSTFPKRDNNHTNECIDAGGGNSEKTNVTSNDDKDVKSKLSSETLLQYVKELSRRGVLSLQNVKKSILNMDQFENLDHYSLVDGKEETKLVVGFPPFSGSLDEACNKHNAKDETQQKLKKSSTSGSLHGNTKAAARRRLTALRKSIKLDPVILCNEKKHLPENLQCEIENSTNFCDKNHVSEKNELMKTPEKCKSRNVLNELDGERSSKTVDTNSSPITKNSKGIEALTLLKQLFSIKEVASACGLDENKVNGSLSPTFSILPKQAAYAGCQPARPVRYGSLDDEVKNSIPIDLVNAFSLDLTSETDKKRIMNKTSCSSRKLFLHQTEAINAALSKTPKHTIVCTGTGSGKSFCFLLPVLSAAMTSNSTSILIFPTKALAQDQFTKLITLLNSSSSSTQMKHKIRPGIIDGDTPHSERAIVSESCNIILTNPDTLHAAILPGWQKLYRKLLLNLRFVVLDEAHVYQGVFGSHVALVLSRLFRISTFVSLDHGNNDSSDITPKQASTGVPTFIACSATLFNPEVHFRSMCPIPKEMPVCVLGPENDGSSCGPKHFFVWNPTLLDLTGHSTGSVIPKISRKGESTQKHSGGRRRRRRRLKNSEAMNEMMQDENNNIPLVMSSNENGKDGLQQVRGYLRRHPAEETAIILANAMKNSIRCIAFCKTRSLVEWVYDRCIAHLRLHPDTSHLVSKVESYRGGYSADVRRSIERKLFQNELLAVVGTSALELGVDIGGIDLTLHCGYPGSLPSLLQQSGRAGRSGAKASFSIVVCFSSPAEQHMWKKPEGILRMKLSHKTGEDAISSISLNPGVVTGHLLCASCELPLTGEYSTQCLLGKEFKPDLDVNFLKSDRELFGNVNLYKDAIQTLQGKGLLQKEKVTMIRKTQRPPSLEKGTKAQSIITYVAHASVKKPSTLVSMRSIEPLSYAIIDLSHPLQGGKRDKLHHQNAMLDTIPYSRVFYHVFPGAIIRHRGKKYRIVSMANPPSVLESFGMWTSNKLTAFAESTNVRYFTQALALTHITVVKRFEFVETPTNITGTIIEKIDDANGKTSRNDKENTAECYEVNKNSELTSTQKKEFDESDMNDSVNSVAGNGVVNIKRTVHGYAKLSPITRSEISRTEIRMPPMEYDTNALWLDSEASTIVGTILDQDSYDHGVHALSHAILAVAPCFVPGCTGQDIDCDHGYRNCTRVMIFDSRAGGAGLCAQLWKFIFCKNGILQAAIDILENCPTCNSPIQEDEDVSGARGRYDGGCPSCIQSGPCMNFNQGLSRRSGLLIGKRMLKRVEQTNLYQRQCSIIPKEENQMHSPTSKDSTSLNEAVLSPRKRKRKKKFRDAFDLGSAKKRHIVVGRPSWPTDHNQAGNVDEEIHDSKCNIGDVYLKSNGVDGNFTDAGGFLTD